MLLKNIRNVYIAKELNIPDYFVKSIKYNKTWKHIKINKLTENDIKYNNYIYCINIDNILYSVNIN